MVIHTYLVEEVNKHVSLRSPRYLFRMIAFEIWYIERVSSRLPLKERGKHVRFPLFLLYVYFH